MKTLFVCLANSKKYGERCIAGVEVKKTKSGYELIEKDGKPKWLRPVTEYQRGAISKNLVKNINLLDILEINVKEYCPKSYQSENAYFEESSLRKVGQKLSNDNLDKLIDMNQRNIFGNRGKAVSEDVIDKVDHSLTLIKVSDFEIYKRESDSQLRMKFEFNNVHYDLPITDLNFIEVYTEDGNLLRNVESLYLTISLAVNHNGWHSKLIAGVLC